MKKHTLLLFLFIAVLIACQNEPDDTKVLQANSENVETNPVNDIRNLMVEYLIWGDTVRNIDLLPVIADSVDSFYVDIDSIQLGKTISSLKKAGFFSNDFLEQYQSLVFELGKKLRTENFQWYVGEMPPMRFASGSNPWCNCQDNLEWTEIVVKPINLEKTSGQLIWKWGGFKENTHPGWGKFEYKFNVKLIDNEWKISYLEGFDLDLIQ